MRILRFAILSTALLSALGFLPQQTSPRAAVSLAAFGETERYLARVQEFKDLTQETYARKDEVIADILTNLRIVEARAKAREAERLKNSDYAPVNVASEVAYAPPPVPPAPANYGASEVAYAPPPAQPAPVNNGASEATFAPPPGPPPPPPPPPPANYGSSDVAYSPPPPGPPPPALGLPAPDLNPPAIVNGQAETFNEQQPVEQVDYSQPTLDVNTNVQEEVQVEIPSTSGSLAGITFQLEELEDRDGCATEITLEEDHTVTVGATDGPLFSRATGTWISLPDQMDMVITRYYDAGQKSKVLTDVGEFSFGVERTYLGKVTTVGERLAVSGTIHISGDELPDDDVPVVGHFNMIDNREGDEDDDEGEDFEEVRQLFIGRSRSIR